MITVITNLKGGVGKSTLSFHLISWLINNNVRTLAVDLDPQQTLTDIIEVRKDEKITPIITLSNMSLISSSHDFTDFAEIVVDVGAQNMVEQKFALIKADRIVIPVMPSQADIWATQRFMKMIKSLRRQDDMPKIFGVINRGDVNPNNYETYDTHETLKLIPDIDVLDTIIYDREDYRSALYEGMACFEFNPSGPATNEIRDLAKSILHT